MAEKEGTEKRALGFTNALVFKQVMRDEDICKGVIGRVTGIDVGEVSYLNTEQEEWAAPTRKGMRADAYLVESAGRLYDVEMQVGTAPRLPFRFRAYQFLLDASTLARGDDYDALRESWVVFMCTKDPFRAGRPTYVLERVCTNNPDVDFDCQAHWLALNAAAWEKVEDNDGLRNLLRYIATEQTTEGDPLVGRIDEEVAKVNEMNGGGGMIMNTLDMLEQEARVKGRWEGHREGRREGREEGRAEGLEEGRAEGREEGHAQGIADGEARYAKLVEALLAENRIDDVRRANADPAAREEMFAEFGF